MSAFFSTFTEIGLVDTRLNSGTIVLPKTTEIPYRVITLKDIYGKFATNTLTLTTQAGETFEDGTTSKIIKNDGAFISLYAGTAMGKWFTMGGTQILSQTISSLTVSTITGDGGYLQNLNAVSSPTLFSTIQGLGTLGYLSSALTNLSSIISTPQLTSTIEGLATFGYISSMQLFSTINNLGLIYNSTTIIPGTNITFNSNGNQITINGKADIVSVANLNSTILGLGTFAYVSTTQLLSSIQGMSQVFTSLSLNISSLQATSLNVSTTAFISSLTVNSLTIGNGTDYLYMGDLITTSLSTLQLNSGLIYGTQIIASTFLGDGSQIVNAPYISTTQLESTIIGLGTLGYLSSAITNLSSIISTPQLISSLEGLGTLGYLSSAIINLSSIISTPQLISSLEGLGTLGYLSSAIINLSSIISTPQLISSLEGLGTLGYLSSLTLSSIISTPQLTSSLVGLGSMGYISSGNVQSTFYINSQYLINQPSYGIFTVQTGFSYTSAPWASQVVQLQNLKNNFSQIQLDIDNQTLIYTGTQPQYFRITYTCGGNQNEVSISRPTLTMQVTSQGITKTYQTVNNIESAGASVTNVIQLKPNDQFIFLIRGLENYTFATIDTTYYEIIAETIVPLSVTTFSTLGVSSLSIIDQATGNYASLVLSNYIYVNGVQVSIAGKDLTSSITGLGTLGYTSSIQLTSSVQGLTNYISSSIQPTTYQIFTVQSGFSYTGAPWASQIVQVQSVATNFGEIQLNLDNKTIVYTGTTIQYFRITYTCGGNQNEVSISRPTLTMQVTSQGITKTYQTVNNIESAGASVTNVIQLNPNDQFIFLIRGLENYTFSSIDTNYYQIIFETVGATALTLFNQSSVSPTLFSTVTGLGSAGYISTSQLMSTTQSLLSISSFSSTFTSSLQANIFQLQSPQSLSYLRQPFIQCGNIVYTELTSNSGISTITLPLSYTSSNTYYPFVQSANSNTTTIITSYTLTANQFIVQWSTLTGSPTTQSFNWNTMGT